jgi:hypothetical protein
MSLLQKELELFSEPNNNYLEMALQNFPQARNIETIKVNEQDTPRLARGIAEGTAVETRDNNRIYNIPTALSHNTWDEPRSAFNASYPFNQVYETKNGHVQEFDDTVGNERYHRFHPSGTFVEIDSEGNEVRKIVGEHFLIIEKHGHIYVKGRADVTIDGSCNILVLNNCNLEINGSLNAVVKNDINMISNGCMNLNVKETLKIRADNMVMETSKFNHKNVGLYNLSTNTYDKIVTDTYVLNVGNFSLKSGDEIVLQGQDKLSVKTDMHLEQKLYVSDEIHVPVVRGAVEYAYYANGANRASSAVVAASLSGASSPDVVSPTNQAPTLTIATDAAQALSTGLIVPNERASVAEPKIVESLPNTRLTRIAIENDGLDSQSDTPLYPNYTSAPPYINANDQSYSEDLEAGRAIPNQEGAISRQPFVNVSSELLVNEPSYNTLISKYFTAGDLSVRAAFPHEIKPQVGLSELDIHRNLQELAVNILDKIVDNFGRNSFVITSGFRPQRGSGKISQHELGQAVDIQFKIPSDEYPKRANELIKILPFDQLLLEYQTGGTGKPWFHISFNKNNLKREYATLYNHKPITSFTRV